MPNEPKMVKTLEFATEHKTLTQVVCCQCDKSILPGKSRGYQQCSVNSRVEYVFKSNIMKENISGSFMGAKLKKDHVPKF